MNIDISVPSRFAVLNIEDDDSRSSSNKNSKKRNDPSNSKVAKKNPKKTSSVPTTAPAKATSSSSKKQKNKQTTKQWEDWKKKDSEIVKDNFEQDMEVALLQSKLEFESNKKKNGVIILSESTSVSSVTNGNKKKKKTMHLDEFLHPEKTTSSEQNNVLDEDVKGEHDDNFFEKMSELAKKEVIKGKVEEERKEREIHIDEDITLALCQEKLKLERARNLELQKQLEAAKAGVAELKNRNQTLCSMLRQGEMKSKADILSELERLTSVKDELTEEVAKLHKQLEQERSKTVVGSSDTVSTKNNKDKKRKKNA